MTQQIVWIVGDWQHPDFAAAIASLNAHARIFTFSTGSEALAAAPTFPASILLVQSRPGQISRHDVERIHAAAPLARLVALLGPWCEGEMRSGQPWPGVVRVPWRTWPNWLLCELEIERSIHTGRLPRTATDTERLARNVTEFWRRAHFDSSAEIWTASRLEFESLLDALAVLGVKATWRQADSQAAAASTNLVIIDGWEYVSRVSASLPRLLLLHFPRPEDCERAIAVGIAAVLGRPLLLDHLAATLGAILPTATVSRESAA